ncbi:MAG: SDR family oxidoreductase [Deltaproteobacteria bacterium]|nr:SDR family oxidoreductase [Deltaproteobacteria bacterium]
MNIFKQKVCIVTGGAGGIGKALCEQLAGQGAIVVATDINEDALNRTVKGICDAGGRCSAAVFNVADYDAFKKCIEDTAGREGRLDYMFNNAGVAFGVDIRDSEIEHWKKVLDINLNGVLHGALTAYKIMAEQGFGHIVNLSSVEGLIPFPFTSSYVVSKFAVMGLSQSMWVEGRDLGIKVSAVCPGFIKTDIFDVSPMVGLDRKKWLEANAKWEKFGVTPEKCAEVILKGVAKDKAIITVTFLAKAFWYLARISPTFILNIILKDFRKWRDKVRVAE